MQSDWKEIYRLTAQRTGKSEQHYKEIGNYIFNRLYKQLRRPTTLITKLKGVGTWHLRKRRMEIMIDYFPPDFSKKPEDFKHHLALLKYENKVEIYEIFKKRLKDYEQYINDITQVRKIRNENKILLPPPKEED